MRERKTLWNFEQKENAKMDLSNKLMSYIFSNSKDDSNAIWAQGILADNGFNTLYTKMNDHNIEQCKFFIQPGDVVVWSKQSEIAGININNKQMEGLSDEHEAQFKEYCLENNIKFVEVTSLTDKEELESNLT